MINFHFSVILRYFSLVAGNKYSFKRKKNEEGEIVKEFVLFGQPKEEMLNEMMDTFVNMFVRCRRCKTINSNLVRFLFHKLLKFLVCATKPKCS